MKKIISLLLSVVCVCCMIGCAKGSVSDVKIDYGASSIYSEDDMNEAIEIIKDKFNTGSWRGFELQSIVLLISLNSIFMIYLPVSGLLCILS